MSDYLQDYSELNKLCNQVECGFHFIYLFFGKIFIFKIAIMIKIIVYCEWKKIMSHTHTHKTHTKRINPCKIKSVYWVLI